MKAVAYLKCLPIDDPDSLIDLTLPAPEPGPRDLLVRVRAVSVNPVDTKLRQFVAPSDGQPRVLGFDAAGVVETVGAAVKGFKPGDEVWYAGSRARSGANAELHVVDERLVGRKPRTLDFAQAAAMPLTTITAWESLFDRLQLPIGRPAGQQSLLITAGAGGVGSIAIQLAKRMTASRVIATASRAESRAQVERLGADLVLDHSQPLSAQLKAAGIRWVDHIFSVSHTDQHFAELAKSIAPNGRLCVIDETGPIDVRLLKPRSASLHWEGMFARSGFELPDMDQQGRLLSEVANLVDGGLIVSTHAKTLGRIDAQTLRAAHQLVESGKMVGKVVLEGF